MRSCRRAIWKNKSDGEINYGFDCTPNELSSLKDELIESIEKQTDLILNKEEAENVCDGILGTLANYQVVIE